MLRVTEFDESGRVRGFDTYDLEDLDRARVRFAELAAPTLGRSSRVAARLHIHPPSIRPLKDGAS